MGEYRDENNNIVNDEIEKTAGQNVPDEAGEAGSGIAEFVSVDPEMSETAAKEQAELEKKAAKEQAALEKKAAKEKAALEKQAAKEEKARLKEQAALEKKARKAAQAAGETQEGASVATEEPQDYSGAI